MRLPSWLRSARPLRAVGPGNGPPHPGPSAPRPPGWASSRWRTGPSPATFTVRNLADDGLGSLRAAVTAANINPGADVIDFARRAARARSP